MQTRSQQNLGHVAALLNAKNDPTSFIDNLSEQYNISSEHKSLLSDIVNDLNNKIVSLKRELNDIKADKYDAIVMQNMSYSSVANKAINLQSIKPPPAPVNEIIIKAKDKSNVKDLQKNVLDEVNKRQKSNNRFQINKIIKTTTGILLKTPATTNSSDIISSFEETTIINDNSVIRAGSKFCPNIALQRVNKITDPTNIIDIICKMNAQLKGLENEMKYCFVLKSPSRTQDIVLRVTPNVYNIIMNMGAVYTDIEKVYVREKVLIRQCQNCFKFNPGHSTKDCDHKICRSCGTDGEHECSKQHKCINCANHPNTMFNQQTNHAPNTRSCPLYNSRIKQKQAKTCYDPSEKIFWNSGSSNPTNT